ncbi:MAG TPA: RDD family protein [Nocardioidaceae bacterium]|nr:RDD family protein [Nocardioidaceae bacterium]
MTRFVAAVIDGVLVALVLLVGYAGLCIVLFMLDPRNFTFPDLELVVSLASGFLVLVVYLTIAWWISGRSYGCLVMGLRVVGFRGENMRLLGALVRAVMCAVFPIGLLWVAFSRENRSAQDMLLRTSVIYDWQPKAPNHAHPRR